MWYNVDGELEDVTFDQSSVAPCHFPLEDWAVQSYQEVKQLIDGNRLL